MKRGEQGVKTANIVMCSVVLIMCSWLFLQTFEFAQGASGAMSPAYFPRMILIVILVTAVLELVASVRLRVVDSFLFDWTKGVKLILFIAVMTLFISLLGVIPFMINASLALFSLGLVLRLPLVPSLVTAISLSVTTYYIFTAGFNIIL
ncbi:tripartite tricarboxylate transporter TctB family protein [Salipaludibacillus agaradhaerens]|nr:tripartite tricarboxylate transporter TctB family protein [Salipaludibacillus agaradhaerens]